MRGSERRAPTVACDGSYDAEQALRTTPRTPRGSLGIGNTAETVSNSFKRRREHPRGVGGVLFEIRRAEHRRKTRTVRGPPSPISKKPFAPFAHAYYYNYKRGRGLNDFADRVSTPSRRDRVDDGGAGYGRLLLWDSTGCTGGRWKNGLWQIGGLEFDRMDRILQDKCNAFLRSVPQLWNFRPRGGRVKAFSTEVHSGVAWL